MGDWLEVWTADDRRLVALESDRVTIGAEAVNDLCLDADPTVSRLHAVLERMGEFWTIRDLGSRNGVYVNGERLARDRVLRPGDEVVLGRTRLVVKTDPHSARPTEALAPLPALTPREREVLVELCRPLASGSTFREPAGTRDVAERLFVSEAAVKQHLARLYDKFQITDAGGRRRVLLANAAIERGAVLLSELRDG